jgi:uncharacterized damage-inducible protein DinB
MKPFFAELFQYTFHFNDKVTDALIASNIVPMPEKALTLLNHTINAHEIWNARINGSECHTQVWEMRPIDKLKAINVQNYNDSLAILKSADLETVISYTNSKGQPFTNTIKDILFHIINHSTYHRGQIATSCKENGITPLVTDYIFYKRDLEV